MQLETDVHRRKYFFVDNKLILLLHKNLKIIKKMRKILLFGFTALVSFGATAQSRTSNLLDLGATPAPKTLKTVDAATLNKLHAAKKKTRANTVRYNTFHYVSPAEHGIAASDMYAYEQSFGGSNPNGRMVTNYLSPFNNEIRSCFNNWYYI